MQVRQLTRQMGESKICTICFSNQISSSCSLSFFSRYVFGSGEERNMRAMMGSALGGADFEWAKTGDLQAEYMDTSETLGNDLDKVDIDPQFQV